MTVATVEDELNEAAETFTVSLSGVTLPDGVSLNADKDEATGTIEDDDALTVSVAGPGANVEEGQTATFTVTVTGTSTSAVVVSYEVDTACVDGELRRRLHGAAGPGVQLTIGAGVASGTIQIVTATDAVLEPDETLVLKLTAASTAGAVSVAAAATAQATIEDHGHGDGVGGGCDRPAKATRCSSRWSCLGRCRVRLKVSYATSDDTGADRGGSGHGLHGGVGDGR